MNCTNCGIILPNESKFCSNCGKETSKRDPNKIIKQDNLAIGRKFRTNEKGLLTLYFNRLTWISDEREVEIGLDEITNVSVINVFGVNVLEIVSNDIKLSMYKPDPTRTMMGLFVSMELAVLSNPGENMIAWREIIDKFRLNL